jgi:uncharacterized protein YjiS (DUF1127 family)
MIYIHEFFMTLSYLITNSVLTFKKAVRARKIYEELNNLSDRELRDLGINRCDIPTIAFENVKSQAFR